MIHIRSNGDEKEEENPHPAIAIRELAKQNLDRQAERMLSRTRNKLKEVRPGECVAVFVSEFDRGRGDPANIVGVVLEAKDGRYRIGTRAGIIKNWLERNSFERTKFTGISKKNIPNNEVSIREIVCHLSVGTGQGFKKCSCKSNCNNKRCACFKSDLKCNSACHKGKSCENHD